MAGQAGAMKHKVALPDWAGQELVKAVVESGKKFEQQQFGIMYAESERVSGSELQKAVEECAHKQFKYMKPEDVRNFLHFDWKQLSVREEEGVRYDHFRITVNSDPEFWIYKDAKNPDEVFALVAAAAKAKEGEALPSRALATMHPEMLQRAIAKKLEGKDIVVSLDMNPYLERGKTEPYYTFTLSRAVPVPAQIVEEKPVEKPPVPAPRVEKKPPEERVKEDLNWLLALAKKDDTAGAQKVGDKIMDIGLKEEAYKKALLDALKAMKPYDYGKVSPYLPEDVISAVGKGPMKTYPVAKPPVAEKKPAEKPALPKAAGAMSYDDHLAALKKAAKEAKEKELKKELETLADQMKTMVKKMEIDPKRIAGILDTFPAGWMGRLEDVKRTRAALYQLR